LFEIAGNSAVERIAGYVTQQSERRDADGRMHEEIQIFRGNKDVYGEAFRYVDRSQIRSTSRPADLLLVERMEFGPAIVEAVAVRTPEARVAPGAADYDAALERITEVGEDTRASLKRIERQEIGAINREMEALERAQRTGSVTPEVAAARQAELQTAFERLKA